MRPSEHVLDAGGPSLSYGTTTGPSPALVMLHGVGARWQVFQPLMLRLRDRSQMIAVDLRGHGTSARTRGGYHLDDFSTDVVRLINAVTQPPVILYGHSLGGWIGLHIAANHPELVRALIVADSAIYPEGLDPDFAVSYLADLPLALRSLAKSLNQLDPDVMAHLRDGRLMHDYRADELLARIACPTLLLQGDPERGALMRDEDVSRAMELLPDGQHVRLDGVGHGLHVEDGEAVSAAVIRFLDGLDGAPPSTRAEGEHGTMNGRAIS